MSPNVDNYKFILYFKDDIVVLFVFLEKNHPSDELSN